MTDENILEKKEKKLQKFARRSLVYENKMPDYLKISIPKLNSTVDKNVSVNNQLKGQIEIGA